MTSERARVVLASHDDTISHFDYERAEVPINNHFRAERARSLYDVRHLRFPSVGDNGQPEHLFTADYHQSRLPGKKPLVVVLPIWGSAEYPSSKTVRSIRKRSAGHIHVINVRGSKPLFHWRTLAQMVEREDFEREVERNVSRTVNTVRDLRRLIDWLETQPEVDPQRIGVVGFSMGALIAAPLLAAEPRLDSGVLVMGAARPHRVAAACGGNVGVARRALRSRFGWSRADYEQILERHFLPLDTARYPGRVDPGKVLIIDADRDRCMPEAAREDLWAALGQPERITFEYGHQTSFLAMTPLGFHTLSQKIYRFFAKSFATANEAPCCPAPLAFATGGAADAGRNP